MATLKTLLDSALKASSTNAFWSSTGITVAEFTAPSDWSTGTKSYTPPCDGHLLIASPYASGVQIYSSTSRLYLTSVGTEQPIRLHSASLPVRKGEGITILVFLREGATTETSKVKFFPCKGQA